MEKTKYTGQEVTIKVPPHIFYSIFNDMSRIGNNVPADLKDSVVCDADSISITKSGLTLGIRRGECIPFSKVGLESQETSPINFDLAFLITPEGADSSRIKVELDVELNAMMKMMMGGKFQQIVDKLTFYLGDISDDMFTKLKEQYS